MELEELYCRALTSESLHSFCLQLWSLNISWLTFNTFFLFYVNIVPSAGIKVLSYYVLVPLTGLFYCTVVFRYFDAEAGTVSWVGSLLCGVYLMSGPLVGGLVNRSRKLEKKNYIFI